MDTSHIERPGGRALWHPLLRMLLIGALSVLASLASGWAALAAPAVLLKDINPGLSRFSQDGIGPTGVGNQVFFTGNDPENGHELWVSDGTTVGTRLVYDIYPGTESSWPAELASVGERVFFRAVDSEGFGLWVSDGTSAGTLRLASHLGALEQLTDVNGNLYFISGTSLWRSDGTVAGTKQIKDFGDTPPPIRLTNVAGKLFFIASDAVHGRELWVSDGTSMGTTMVADLNPSGNSFSTEIGSPELTAVGDTLYFITTEGPMLYQFWRSDGTVAGTKRVTSTGAIELMGAEELENVAGTLYFNGISRIDAVTYSIGLWRSDGTAPGTVELRSFSTGTSMLGAYPARLIGAGSRLFFVGPEARMWTSDGTPGGTVGLAVGTTGVIDKAFRGATDVQGRYFFAGDDGSGDIELWMSDGTVAGTQRVKNINPTDSSSPFWMTSVGNAVFFGLPNTSQLWRSDGTDVGTTLMTDQAVAPAGNNTYAMSIALGQLFFTADDGVHGSELWMSDGSAAGTHMIKDINPSGSSTPLFLTPLGNALYFMTSEPSLLVLWRTDGTEAGTQMVKSFVDARVFPTDGLQNIGGTLYFIARDPGGDRLWKSNGTSSGTVPVASFSAVYWPPSNLVGVNGRPVFVASDGIHGRELWVSDGTAASTKVLKHILVGLSNTDSFGLSVVNNELFFTALGDPAYELWKSDGTTSGTVRVSALGLGAMTEPSSSLPADFTPVGSRLFFTMSQPNDLRSLWLSDGTAAGTRAVRDVFGHTFPNSENLAALNDRLLFSWDDGVHGRELWISDGTSVGTALVKDINPGVAASGLANIHQVNRDGWALFAASAGPDGVELWRTNGTMASTQQLQDLAPGAGSSNPKQFVGVGAQIYFIANDGRTGPELWSLNQKYFQELLPLKHYLPLISR